MIFSSSPVWMAAGWTMLHLVWAGTLIGALAAIARRALRSARSEARYAVALAALMILTASPVAIFATQYERPVATFWPAATEPAPALAATVSRDAAGPASRTVDRPRRVETRAAAALSRVEVLVPYLPWLWIAGSLSTLALLATGLVAIEGLRRSCRPIQEGPVVLLLHDLAASLGIVRRVAVGVCDQIASPVLIGIIRPLILLPPAVLCGWGLDQLEMVLLHELAHLRRRDNLVNLAQRFAEALLFFHPATWWLSAWVRLERELCCDRIVIDRVGEPNVYAEMLVSLAAPGRGRRPRGATAMADGPMLTRVRRLFNLEDRSMKLSMPEGVGIAGAIALVATLALGSRAGAPNDLDARRAMARKAVARLEALRVPREWEDNRINALEAFAQVQLQLGDREGGVATLKRTFEAIEKKELPASEEAIARAHSLIDIPRILRTQGETDAARAMLDQVTKLIDAHKEKPADPTRIAPVEGDRNIVMRVEHFSGNLVLGELLGVLAQERLKLGDRDEALRLFRRTADCLKDEPAGLRALYLGYLASETHRAGDQAGARELIDRARKLADGLAAPAEKEAALAGVSLAMARTGDLDAALEELARQHPARLISTLDGFVREMTEYDNRPGWYGPGSLKITIGADIYKITDVESARRDLPRFATAAARLDAPLAKARLLARIAHLQARAGDFAGARKTAEAIPAVQRENFPGPSDGFYDAVRPVAFALLARERAEAGDRSRVEAEFREALDAARALKNVGEKSIALMVIGRERARLGDRSAALAVLGEVEPLVTGLTEPRRSRSLAMIAAARIDAGDLAGAAASAEAVRSFPRLEKLNTLRRIADAHRRAGDVESYRAFLRRELAVCEAAAPKDAKAGPHQRLTAISIDTFIDPDLEAMPGMDEFQSRDRSIIIRGLLDGPEVALKLLRDLPADDPKLVRIGAMTRKRNAYTSLVAMLVYRGDLAAAEAVVEAISDPDLKLAAMIQVAFTLEDVGAK